MEGFMKIHDSYEEYRAALKTGQRIYKELSDSGRDPHPAVLAELLPAEQTDSAQDIGLMEIPIERIVGTTAAARVTAFTADFRPLLGVNSEFASKWMGLCDAHLSDEGIRDPIVCIEYLGNFYVQEGNKRVSVLRHFGAPRIPGMVIRVIPPVSDDPKIIAYHEFLDFYKCAGLYDGMYRTNQKPCRRCGSGGDPRIHRSGGWLQGRIRRTVERRKHAALACVHALLHRGDARDGR